MNHSQGSKNFCVSSEDSFGSGGSQVFWKGKYFINLYLHEFINQAFKPGFYNARRLAACVSLTQSSLLQSPRGATAERMEWQFPGSLQSCRWATAAPPTQHPLLLLFFLPTPSLSSTLHPFPGGWGCEFPYSSQDLLTVKLPIECLRLCHLGEEWVSLWACNPDIPCSISLVDFYSFRGCWKWKM